MNGGGNLPPVNRHGVDHRGAIPGSLTAPDRCLAQALAGAGASRWLYLAKLPKDRRTWHV